MQESMRALSDPTRRNILHLLKERERTVGEIAGQFDMSMPAISKHLSILQSAGLIRERREGKYVYCELNASVLEEVLLWLRELKGETV